jgi:hypothetical protein
MREQVNRFGFNWVLLLYIQQHAGLFRRRTNVNDVIDNNKTNCQMSMVRGDKKHESKNAIKKPCYCALIIPFKPFLFELKSWIHFYSLCAGRIHPLSFAVSSFGSLAKNKLNNSILPLLTVCTHKHICRRRYVSL